MSAAAPEPKANMGPPEPRIDGRLKVTGQARYPADVPVSNPLYAYLVTSAIARGRITSFDLGAARGVPGVADILTHENTHGDVKQPKFFADGGYASTSIRPLDSAQIWHDGQIIALVLAETYEAAREAAHRVKVNYVEETPTATFDDAGASTQLAKEARKTHEDPEVGNFDEAFRTAEVKLDEWYSTPTQHHNAMELFATTCAWAGPQLTIYEPSQFVYGLQNGVAEQLGIDPEHIRVVSTFIGGAFGSKGSTTPRTALVAIAARRLGRPVKLVATRDQGFTIATYRAETRHHLRLGAARDGKLVALSHEGWEVTSRPDAYMVSGTDTTSRMYAVPNVATNVSIVHADRNTPGFMRSPPETPYMYALESAMDELAVKLAMDPVELRRTNDTMKEPIKGLPYTSRSLMQCFEEASRTFGWSKRNPQPGSMRDGDWLIGWGCATACYPTHIAPATARVRLTPDGEARVETAAHDIGTGTYTVIGQVVAEKLGLPLEKVAVLLGDSQLPPAPVSGGSNVTASVCTVVAKACDAIRSRLGNPNAAELMDALKRQGAGAIEEYAENVSNGPPPESLPLLYKGAVKMAGGATLKDRIQYAFGAEFVEVRVHALTREIRVPRAVGAFAAGRIMNTRTAHSQLMGGMVWGIASALHEATEIDRRAARYVNDNFADYLVPVNADVNQLDVILVSEEDTKVNPLGIKGLGELGNVGTAAAVANAVFHATGRRVRDLPIRIDALLA
ncbi:MAG: xanthine dehydrogenase family protein molybdopterin-binding subunit [Methylobacteriaceae bacterium]|nr:xanthine dehydrogenase family protein molybdopterin-binding subunit [Methylobacteriaceae bacterium]